MAFPVWWESGISLCGWSSKVVCWAGRGGTTRIIGTLSFDNHLGRVKTHTHTRALQSQALRTTMADETKGLEEDFEELEPSLRNLVEQVTVLRRTRVDGTAHTALTGGSQTHAWCIYGVV